MSLAPKPKPKSGAKNILSHLSDRGASTKKYSLIRAVYNDRNEQAEKILKADPDQISLQDPFAGLTALHIAIFRQNERLVTLLAAHPSCNLTLKDNFGRIPADMLIYTTNWNIFHTVMTATHPEKMRTLEEDDFEEGLKSGKIVPLKKPKPPETE